MFKSKFEEELAKFYKIEDVYETDKLEYILTNRYTPDFSFGKTYVEAKGYWKPSDRRKMLEVIKQHPDKKFIMFFQDASVKLTKRGKMTYGEWCDKQGIEWFCWKRKKPTKRIFNLATKSSTNKPI